MVQSELKATQCYLNLVFVDLSVSGFDRSTGSIGWINPNLAVSSRTSFLLLSPFHLMMFPFDQTHLFLSLHDSDMLLLSIPLSNYQNFSLYQNFTLKLHPFSTLP